MVSPFPLSPPPPGLREGVGGKGINNASHIFIHSLKITRIISLGSEGKWLYGTPLPLTPPSAASCVAADGGGS